MRKGARWKKVVAGIVALLALPLLYLVIYFRSDVDPPADSDLALPVREISEEENAWFDFLEAGKIYEESDLAELDFDFNIWEPEEGEIDEETFENISDRVAPMVEAIEQSLVKSRCVAPPAIFEQAYPHVRAGRLYRKFLGLRIDRELENEDFEGVRHSLAKMRKLSYLIGEAGSGGLSLVLAEGLALDTVKIITEIVGEHPEESARFKDLLESVPAVQRRHLGLSIRADYLNGLLWIDAYDEGEVEYRSHFVREGEVRSKRDKFLFLPNRSKVVLADGMRRLLEVVDDAESGEMFDFDTWDSSVTDLSKIKTISFWRNYTGKMLARGEVSMSWNVHKMFLKLEDAEEGIH